MSWNFGQLTQGLNNIGKTLDNLNDRETHGTGSRCEHNYRTCIRHLDKMHPKDAANHQKTCHSIYTACLSQ